MPDVAKHDKAGVETIEEQTAITGFWSTEKFRT